MALHPIIEAFLQAREQASRDFDQDANRKFQGEQQKQLFQQQLTIQKNQLDQEKIIRDAEQKLREREIDLRGQLGKQAQDVAALGHIGEGLAKGTLNFPTKQSLNPRYLENDQPTTIETPDLEGMISALSPMFGGDSKKAEAAIKLFRPSSEYFGEQLKIKEVEAGIKAKQESEKERVKHGYKMEEIGEQGRLQGQNQLAVAQERSNSTREAAQIRANATLNAAAMRLAAKSKESGAAASDPTIMRGIISGDYAIDDLPKLFPVKERSAVVHAAAQDGIKILRKEDVSSLDRAGIISQVVENVQKLADLYKSGYMKNAAQISQVRASIEGVLGQPARGIAGEKGVLTQKDIERVQKMLPSWYNSNLSYVAGLVGNKFDINQEDVKTLQKYVNATYGHVFHGMKSDQANILRHKYGLENSGIYLTKDQLPE